jgi:hypothetical protein
MLGPRYPHVVDRDEEGRPVASRNAGAFLSPVGMIPVPSSILDHEREENDRRSWRAAILTAVAVWVVLVTLLRYMLAATEPELSITPVTWGHHMTRLMHEPLAWYGANAVFVAVGMGLSRRLMPSHEWLGWALMTVGAVAAVVLLGALSQVTLLAIVIVIGAPVWLVVAYLRY